MDADIKTRMNELKGKPQSEWSEDDVAFWNSHATAADAIRAQGTPADKVAEQTLRVADTPITNEIHDVTPESPA